LWVVPYTTSYAAASQTLQARVIALRGIPQLAPGTERKLMSTESPDLTAWSAEVKARPEAAGIGLLLSHQGIVRGSSRSGEPVTGMELSVDRERLAAVLAEAATWPGIVAVRAWVNEGSLAVGDDIMKVLVAGDIREHVFDGLQRLVGTIKREVVTEFETR